MRIQSAILLMVVASAVGCTHRNNERVGEAARKAQQASTKAMKQLGKVARKAGEQIKSASHDAHEGYVEEKEKEKTRQKDR